jgi:hypothetical protein
MFEMIKKAIKKKILKSVLGFLASNAVPIILGLLTIVIVVAGASAVFNAFSSWFGGTPVNEAEEMKKWAEGLTDEEVQQLIESGSSINPKLIPDYIETEQKGIPANKTVQMDVKQTTWTPSDFETDKWTEPHELKLYNTAYPYRLQWKLVAGLDIIDPKSTVWEFWKKDIINQADQQLQPIYHWKYDTYSKDITEGTQWWVTETHDGVSTSRKVKEVNITKYYPLEFLEKVEGTFADYNFTYKEDVETLDTGWVYVEGSSSTRYWTTGGDPIEDENGNVIGHTKVHHHSRTTWQEKRKIVVEDLLDDIIKTPRLDRIAGLFNENKITLDDIEMLAEVVNNMPDTQDLTEDIGDILAITSLGLDAGNYQATEFNPDVPIIEGNWTRSDLLDTAMSILDLYYFWGGKYPYNGANPDWGKSRVVTAKGNWATGQAIPLGLDCSGFVDWVYVQMTGKTIGKGGGTVAQFANTYPISESELRVGDLGFYRYGGGVHVGIYAGTSNGKKLFIHSGGRQWKDSTHIAGRVVITYNNTSEYYKGNAPSKFKYFRRPYVTFADDPEAQESTE